MPTELSQQPLPTPTPHIPTSHFEATLKMASNSHLAALLALLLGTAQADAHRYRNHHHHHGRRIFKPAFEMATVEAFRPFHASPRGSGLFNSAGPLVDVFQEVMGDVKRGEPLEIACILAASAWMCYICVMRVSYRLWMYAFMHSSSPVDAAALFRPRPNDRNGMARCQVRSCRQIGSGRVVRSTNW